MKVANPLGLQVVQRPACGNPAPKLAFQARSACSYSGWCQQWSFQENHKGGLRDLTIAAVQPKAGTQHQVWGLSTTRRETTHFFYAEADEVCVLVLFYMVHPDVSLYN